MYDAIIIGMGPAGMSAGIYTSRAGLKTLMLDEYAPGGLLNKISIVENYLGFKSISGQDLALKMFEHVRNEEIEYKIEKVLNITNNENYKIVTTTKREYKTKGVIIAIGRKPKKSGIANEEKYFQKGISYCAICDAALYKDKEIVVLGGGNSALEESIYLSKFTSKITILARSELKADDILINEAKEKGINIRTHVEVTEFLGENYIEGVKLNTDETISCSGVFIYYGYQADTAFLNTLKITNEKGYIEVDSKMKTKTDKIYACGDIIQKDIYQISTAVSDGTIAALSLQKDIRNIDNN